MYLVVMSAGFCGCNKSNYPHTTPVGGTLTYRGEAVAGATVMLAPAGVGGRNCHGVTDIDGAFEITTFEVGDGAIPGKYTIAVSKMVMSRKMSQAESDLYKQEVGERPPHSAQQNHLPVKYRDHTSSGLTGVVPETGELTLTLNLVD